MSLIITIILIIVVFCIKTDDKYKRKTNMERIDNEINARKVAKEKFLNEHLDLLFEDDCRDEVVAKGEKYIKMRDKIERESGYSSPPDGIILLALMGERCKVSKTYIEAGIENPSYSSCNRERDKIRYTNEFFSLMRWYDSFLLQHGMKERLMFIPYSDKYPMYRINEVPEGIKRYRGSFGWIDHGCLRSDGVSIYKRVT